MISASTLDGKLVMLPRAQFDVSALYYQKSLYERRGQEDGLQGKVPARISPRRTPGKQVTDQAEFFASPAEFLRHAVRRQGRGHQRSLL